MYVSKTMKDRQFDKGAELYVRKLFFLQDHNRTVLHNAYHAVKCDE